MKVLFVQLPALNLFLISLILAMGFAAWQIPLWKQQRLVDTLSEKLKVVSAEADHILHLKKTLDEHSRSFKNILDNKRNGHTFSDVLLELTNRIPDNSWIEQLKISKYELIIRGESKEATALINRLEKSPMFEDVQFQSSIVTIPGTLYERFYLSAKLSKRGGE